MVWLVIVFFCLCCSCLMMLLLWGFVWWLLLIFLMWVMRVLLKFVLGMSCLYVWIGCWWFGEWIFSFVLVMVSMLIMLVLCCGLRFVCSICMVIWVRRLFLCWVFLVLVWFLICCRCWRWVLICCCEVVVCLNFFVCCLLRLRGWNFFCRKVFFFGVFCWGVGICVLRWMNRIVWFGLVGGRCIVCSVFMGLVNSCGFLLSIWSGVFLVCWCWLVCVGVSVLIWCCVVMLLCYWFVVFSWCSCLMVWDVCCCWVWIFLILIGSLIISSISCRVWV